MRVVVLVFLKIQIFIKLNKNIYSLLVNGGADLKSRVFEYRPPDNELLSVLISR